MIKRMNANLWHHSAFKINQEHHQPIVFVLFAKTNGRILFCAILTNTRANTKCMDLNLYPDGNIHHYDYTGFLVGLLVVICIPTLLVYGIYHTKCIGGKMNTFGVVFIYHYIVFKQPA